MNRNVLICLGLLLLTSVYTQWTPVISEQFRSPNPSDQFTFLAGVPYTFEVTGENQDISQVYVFGPESVLTANTISVVYGYDSGTSKNSIQDLTLAPSADITLAFIPQIAFPNELGEVTLIISDDTDVVKTITRRSTFTKLNAPFEATQNQVIRVFIKKPFIATPLSIFVCSQPVLLQILDPDSQCIISDNYALDSNDPVQTYLTATIPQSGIYYLSVFVVPVSEPVYVTIELSNCYNSILDTGEQCDFGRDTEMCNACQAAYGYVCTGTAGGASSCSGYCGNAIKTFGQQCDNGNLPGCVGCLIEDGYTCETNDAGSSVCKIVPGCNNGIVEQQLGEQCDNRGGIGCTDTCEIIAGFACQGSPSVCNNCGNHIIEGTQQCDGGYFCRADCRLFTCNNNGIWESGENCDNGGTNGDGCSDNCFIEPEYNCTGFINAGIASACVHLYTCGNAIFEPFNNFREACDNGNAEGCSQNCQIDFGWKCYSFIGYPSFCERVDNTLCGNGNLDLGEKCDDGDTDNGDGCNEYCQVEAGFICPLHYLCFLTSGNQCGNGYYQPQLGEGCDDGNIGDKDGCSATCVEQSGYTCQIDQHYLKSFCITNCGNGVYMPNEGEGCDDLNKINGDGCSSTCQIENGYYCSFNVIGRRSVCQKILHDAFCGDGYVQGNEQCDDGFFVLNHSPDGRDGCDKYCRIQFGWNCISSNVNNFRGISSCYRIFN